MPVIPFVRYLVESVSALCYASSWFVRLGGASGLMYFIENYPDSVVFANMSEFIESLVEVRFSPLQAFRLSVVFAAMRFRLGSCWYD